MQHTVVFSVAKQWMDRGDGKRTHRAIFNPVTDEYTQIHRNQNGNHTGSRQQIGLPIGHKLNSLIIESELGVGGFGITYLARHAFLTNHWMACKEYFPTGAAIRETNVSVRALSEVHESIYEWGLQRFLDEARILSSFSHPNIVKVKDYFEENSTAYMVMDYIKGKNLHQFIEDKGTLNEHQLRAILNQLLGALDLVHQDGVLHRDITPTNILIQSDDTPVLIDFGSARYAMRTFEFDQHNPSSADPQLTTMFTRGYSPIEQYEQGGQGPCTDIYALAATMYFAAFGVRPPDALQRSGEFRSKKKDILESATEKGAGKFSPQLLAALDFALNIYPENRPQSTTEWLEILGSPDVTVVRPQRNVQRTELDRLSPPSVQSRASSHRVMIPALIGCILLLCGIFVFERYRSNEAAQLAQQATEALRTNPLDRMSITKARQLYETSLARLPDQKEASLAMQVIPVLDRLVDHVESWNGQQARSEFALLTKQAADTELNQILIPPIEKIIRCREEVQSVSADLAKKPMDAAVHRSVRAALDEHCVEEKVKLQPVYELVDRLTLANNELDRADSQSEFDSVGAIIADAEKSSPAFIDLQTLENARAVLIAEENRWQGQQQDKAERISSVVDRARQQLVDGPISISLLEETRNQYLSVLDIDAGYADAQSIAQTISNLIESIQEMDSSVEAIDIDGVDRKSLEVLDYGDQLTKLADLDENFRDKVPRLIAARQRDVKGRHQNQKITEALRQIRSYFESPNSFPYSLVDVQSNLNNVLAVQPTHVEANKVLEIMAVAKRIDLHINQNRFNEARESNARLAAELSSIGYSPKLVSELKDRIDQSEQQIIAENRESMIRSLITRAADIIENSPMSSENLSNAQSLYDELQALDPGNSVSVEGRAAVSCLMRLVKLRLNDSIDAYNEMVSLASQCEQRLSPLKLDLRQLDIVIETVRQRRQARALDQLSRAPFSDNSWINVETAYRDDSLEPRIQVAVNDSVEFLRLARALKEEDRYLEAAKEVYRAEQSLLPLVENVVFDRAHDELRNQKNAWMKKKLSEAGAYLISKPLDQSKIALAIVAYEGWFAQYGKDGIWSIEFQNAWINSLEKLRDNQHETSKAQIELLIGHLSDPELLDSTEISQIRKTARVVQRRLRFK